MSIIYCEKHDRKWDSDFKEDCPMCENDPENEIDRLNTRLAAAEAECRALRGLLRDARELLSWWQGERGDSIHSALMVRLDAAIAAAKTSPDDIGER